MEGPYGRKYDHDAMLFSCTFLNVRAHPKACEVLHYFFSYHALFEHKLDCLNPQRGVAKNKLEMRRWPCVIFHISPHSCHLLPIHFLTLIPLGSPFPPPNNAPGCLRTLKPSRFTCYWQPRLKIRKMSSIIIINSFKK